MLPAMHLLHMHGGGCGAALWTSILVLQMLKGQQPGTESMLQRSMLKTQTQNAHTCNHVSKHKLLRGDVTVACS